jgi:4,5-DOPA dioxygenase extradiol
MNTQRASVLPSLFVSHGAPTLALEVSPTGHFLDGLGPALPRPRAILIASAHLLAAQPVLTAASAPATLHDFGGFPRELYALRYPAPGAPELAQHAADLLRAAGFAAGTDVALPLDHGAWVPLLRMFPQADIPVVALNVSPQRDAAWHYGLGAALAPLRADNVLVIGSGGFVHNLGALDWQHAAHAPVAWAQAFAAWLAAHVTDGDSAMAKDWQTQAPQAQRAHPTPEHLLPLFIAWGAAGGAGVLLHEAWEYATLALHAFRFDGAT